VNSTQVLTTLTFISHVTQTYNVYFGSRTAIQNTFFSLHIYIYCYNLIGIRDRKA